MNPGRTWAGGSITALRFPAFTDARGTLRPLDFAALGFEVRRAFLVTAPAGARRGGHAHRLTRQILVATAGEVHLAYAAGGESGEIALAPGGPPILIAPGVWTSQTYCGAAPCLLVFADRDYDPADYVRTRPVPGQRSAEAG